MRQKLTSIDVNRLERIMNMYWQLSQEERDRCDIFCNNSDKDILDSIEEFIANELSALV